MVKMKKTKAQLLLDYKKANKERRAKILEASKKTEKEYLDYLLGKSSRKKKEEKPTIHNVYIVDVSGSMAGMKIKNAIDGVNQEIVELQRDNTVNYTQTIVEFSSYSDIKTVMYKVPIASCGRYSSYDRGMTALNQAIGETLAKLLNDNKSSEKVLVKIFTDGGENNSQGPYRDNKTLSELIKTCEGNGFTIAFVGTSYDVDKVVQNLHIHVSNTLVHDNTARGVAQAFGQSASATMAYSANVKAKKSVTENFYSKKIGKLD